MKRRLFTIFSALSLLVFVAVVVLWVRSYRVQDGYHRADRREDAVVTCDLYTHRGSVVVSHWRFMWVGGSTEHVKRERARTYVEKENVLLGRVQGAYSRPPQQTSAADFTAWPRWSRKTWPDRRFLLVQLPMWPLAVLTLSLPIYWLFGKYRCHIVLTRGLCPSCGYDLRATPDRCPECGTVGAQVPEAQKETTK